MARPFIHGDSSSGADVDGTSGAEAFNIADVVGECQKLFCNTVIFGAKDEGSIFFEGFFVKLVGAWGVVFNGD